METGLSQTFQKASEDISFDCSALKYAIQALALIENEYHNQVQLKALKYL